MKIESAQSLNQRFNTTPAIFIRGVFNFYLLSMCYSPLWQIDTCIHPRIGILMFMLMEIFCKNTNVRTLQRNNPRYLVVDDKFIIDALNISGAYHPKPDVFRSPADCLTPPPVEANTPTITMVCR